MWPIDLIDRLVAQCRVSRSRSLIFIIWVCREIWSDWKKKKKSGGGEDHQRTKGKVHAWTAQETHRRFSQQRMEWSVCVEPLECSHGEDEGGHESWRWASQRLSSSRRCNSWWSCCIVGPAQSKRASAHTHLVVIGSLWAAAVFHINTQIPSRTRWAAFQALDSVRLSRGSFSVAPPPRILHTTRPLPPPLLLPLNNKNWSIFGASTGRRHCVSTPVHIPAHPSSLFLCLFVCVCVRVRGVRAHTNVHNQRLKYFVYLAASSLNPLRQHNFSGLASTRPSRLCLFSPFCQLVLLRLFLRPVVVSHVASCSLASAFLNRADRWRSPHHPTTSFVRAYSTAHTTRGLPPESTALGARGATHKIALSLLHRLNLRELHRVHLLIGISFFSPAASQLTFPGSLLCAISYPFFHAPAKNNIKPNRGFNRRLNNPW